MGKWDGSFFREWGGLNLHGLCQCLLWDWPCPPAQMHMVLCHPICKEVCCLVITGTWPSMRGTVNACFQFASSNSLSATLLLISNVWQFFHLSRMSWNCTIPIACDAQRLHVPSVPALTGSCFCDIDTAVRGAASHGALTVVPSSIPVPVRFSNWHFHPMGFRSSRRGTRSQFLRLTCVSLLACVSMSVGVV